MSKYVQLVSDRAQIWIQFELLSPTDQIKCAKEYICFYY